MRYRAQSGEIENTGEECRTSVNIEIRKDGGVMEDVLVEIMGAVDVFSVTAGRCVLPAQRQRPLVA